MKTFLFWTGAIAALAVVYGLFELPGLLVGLFVAGAVVTGRVVRGIQRQKGSLALLDIDGVRIDFAAMTMTAGDEEYALRRKGDGRWERRATSETAIGKVVNRRMNSLTDDQNAAAFERVKELALQASGNDSSARLIASQLGKIMTSLPPGSAARRTVRNELENLVQEAVAGGSLTQEKVDDLFKKHEEQEILEGMQEWMNDNEGFEPLPLFDARVETAYQRYIHQG